MADLNLTSAEKNIVQYHRDNIKNNNVGMDEQGRPVTVYTTTIEIQGGKYKGQFANVPGYVDGKIINDEDALYDRWSKDIDSGKWPIFKTGKEGGDRAMKVHQIMDDEEQEARDSLRKQRMIKRPLLNDKVMPE